MARKVKLTELTDHMFVVRDIYAEELLIVPKNTRATPRMAAKLEMYGIPWIEVYEKHDEAKDEISMTSYFDSVQSSAEFHRFHRHYDHVVENMEVQFNDIVSLSARIDVDRLLGQMDYLLDQSDNSYHMFDMLQCMREYDDSTYMHCMNVAVISNMLGHWLRFREDEIATVTLCGLLHDIGKLRVPDYILTKPGKLTTQEYEIIKRHTIDGYELLKNQQLEEPIKLAALEHHEKCDGTGYPYRKKRKEIHKFSKVVAIADVYDAMTANRVYRGALCPFEVISIFEQEGIYKYETEYILKFLEEIANTYINNRVLLSDGTEGKIVMINKRDLSRPLIKVSGGFINLSEKRDLEIKALI